MVVWSSPTPPRPFTGAKRKGIKSMDITFQRIGIVRNNEDKITASVSVYSCTSGDARGAVLLRGRAHVSGDIDRGILDFEIVSDAYDNLDEITERAGAFLHRLRGAVKEQS